MKKTIVISGINFFEGGPLTIFHNVLEELYTRNEYNIIALISDKINFKNFLNTNINFFEFKLSRKSYFFRIYYEYFYFYFLSKKINPDCWISLHDISPNIKAKIKIVYLHNATAFAKPKFFYLFFQPTVFFFTLFYRFLYKINLKNNDYIIVQQNWFKNKLIDLYKINTEKVLVSKPLNNYDDNLLTKNYTKINSFIFFYPALGRVFKNHLNIINAIKHLNKIGITNYEVIFTLDGSENLYSKYIKMMSKNLKNIKFVGKISKIEIKNLYSKSNVLLFPSLIESWGLPLSEYTMYNKPIICSDLPFAHETLSNYNKVIYYNSNNPILLANLMNDAIKGFYKFESNSKIITYNFKNWEDLIRKIC